VRFGQGERGSKGIAQIGGAGLQTFDQLSRVLLQDGETFFRVLCGK
jgi:hypothetical protein